MLLMLLKSTAEIVWDSLEAVTKIKVCVGNREFQVLLNQRRYSQN